ncbi:uncharacterized protein LOC135071320 [Ostrinia nubilalis]|uniref:uncharacterized protein LOC135071320 n=1 Tax=Ostrinia nubilalis TaxID=29057 RepID=UPI0030826182
MPPTPPTTGNKAEDGSKKMVQPDLYRVGVRLPPFWPEEPAVWFAQIEGSFALSGIKDDDTKYYYVSAQLEHRYAAEVKDILVNPPAKNKYDTLKSELIKRLSASREKELTQLLMHEELGDRRPSQFLRHLRHLAGRDIPDDFIRTVWTSRLPTSLQTVIASQPESTLQALADLADKVHDLVPPSPQVASADAVPGSLLEKLTKEVSELSRQVKALSTRDRGRSPSRNSSKQRRERTRSQSSYRKFPNCFYHHKYGDNARTCVKPCDFSSSENGRGGR